MGARNLNFERISMTAQQPYSGWFWGCYA